MDTIAGLGFTVFVLLALCHPASFSIFSNLPGLDRFCKESDGKIQCDIHVVNFLDYKDVRRLFVDLPETAHIVLNITCAEKGQVRLPWPMKSRNILELSVDNCEVFGFHDADSKLVLDFPDRLVSLQMYRCTIESGVLEAIHVLSNQVSRCGQQTLASLIMKNISYELVVEPKDLSKLSSNGIVMDAGDLALEDKLNSGQVCRYKDLEIIDISESPDGMTYFVLPFENSEFPKLTVFNMSNSGIVVFPEIFKNWHNIFPNLEILDLSFNDIEMLHLSKSELNSSIAPRSGPLYLNLRSNRFTKVPTLFEQTSPVIIDLRDNPLQCGCDVIKYRTYLRNMVKLYPSYEYVFDATCTQKDDSVHRIGNITVENC